MTYPTDGDAFTAPEPRDVWDRELEDIRDSHEGLAVMNIRAGIFASFSAERQRQIAKWGLDQQRHPDGTGRINDVSLAGLYKAECEATAGPRQTWRNIFLEEVFEALAETNPNDIEKELVQVGAVVTNWLEDIRSR